MALQATQAGAVTLQDSRNHVWHLKAEWAKTGNMIDPGEKLPDGTVTKGKG